MAATPIDYAEGVSRIQPLITRLFQVLDEGVTSRTILFPHGEYMQAYTVVYDMCTQKLAMNSSAKLYQYHEEVMREYLALRVLTALKQRTGDDALLQEFVSRWDSFKILNRWMRRFFTYLDRYYVGHQNLPLLSDSGLRAFKTAVFDEIAPQVSRAILNKVEQERQGMDVDTSLLKRCVDVFKQVDPNSTATYERALETAYLEETSKHYAARAQTWAETESTPSYLALAEEALQREAQRVEQYLLPSVTLAKSHKILVAVLLREQESFLLTREGSGLEQLLRDERKEDLARVFRMFALCEPNGLVPVAQILQDFILVEGKAIVNRRIGDCAEAGAEKPETSAAFIHSLLDLHTKYAALIQSEFQSDAHFQRALKAAFEQTINVDFPSLADRPMSSAAELLANFADGVLKTGTGNEDSESEMEDKLEKVVSLFSFLSDKDVFSDVYRNLLAKRLLNQRSASPFAERSMIQKLKLKCGSFFTSKLEGMVTDLELGADVARKFAASQQQQQESGALRIDFTCDVLTTGHWPTYRILEKLDTLPHAEMQACIDVYQKFYAAHTAHRKLTWVHSLGNCLVKGTYAKQSYEFQLTTLQTIVLLLFSNLPDEGASLSFQHIAEASKLEADVLKRVLHSLSMQKVKLLIKTPADKKMDEHDAFQVDAAFASKIRKVRIPMASLEDNHNPARVEEDRSMAIEAAIVRIMKSRKRLNHNLLVTEVVNQLRHFKPAPKIIKKKIEHLIERDYLERDETEQNVYKYLA